MSHEIVTTTSLPASPARVWQVLLDFPRYPEWNPFIRSMEGVPDEGSTIRVAIHPPGGRAMTFRPTVLRNRAGQEFRWKGKLLVSGLFDGEHYFILTPAADGTTQFTQGEFFTGLLVPIFRGTLDRGTRTGFEAMNLALKERLARLAG